MVDAICTSGTGMTISAWLAWALVCDSGRRGSIDRRLAQELTSPRPGRWDYVARNPRCDERADRSQALRPSDRRLALLVQSQRVDRISHLKFVASDGSFRNHYA